MAKVLLGQNLDDASSLFFAPILASRPGRFDQDLDAPITVRSLGLSRHPRIKERNGLHEYRAIARR
jgi:hypothetical protein